MVMVRVRVRRISNYLKEKSKAVIVFCCYCCHGCFLKLTSSVSQPDSMYTECWCVGLWDAAILSQHSLILFHVHPLVFTTGPERKEQLVLYWSVSVLLLQAFCQELVLSNHTIHLSHSFRLQPVINKHTNYKSKINFWFIKQWAETASASNLQLMSTTQSRKMSTSWKWSVLNT